MVSSVRSSSSSSLSRSIDNRRGQYFDAIRRWMTGGSEACLELSKSFRRCRQSKWNDIPPVPFSKVPTESPFGAHVDFGIFLPARIDDSIKLTMTRSHRQASQ